MRRTKVPILGRLSIYALIVLMTAIPVLLPALIAGITIHRTQKQLLLDVYSETLTSRIEAIAPASRGNDNNFIQVLEQQISDATEQYWLTLFVINDKSEIEYTNSYHLDLAREEPFPFSRTVYTQMQDTGQTVTRYVDLYRGELMYVAVPVSDTYTAVCVLPTSQFLKSINYVWAVLFAMVIFSALLLLIGLFIIKKWIVTPIKRLLYYMRNPSLPPEFGQYTNWKNEIGQLAFAYGNRVTDFNENLDKISDLNELKRESELEVLQNQINSHFIYNTLNNVQWLASAGRMEDVIATVRALDCLLRACAHNENEMVTIEEELSYVEAYLTAQQIRFGDVFSYQFDVDVLLMQMKIPKFILQPLIENSIYHGFVNCNKKNGMIKVSLHKRGHRIEIGIFDNGIGIEKARIHAVLSNKYKSSGRYMGVALGNVNKRIKLLCGREYGLGIRSNYGEFTLAQVTIPILL